MSGDTFIPLNLGSGGADVATVQDGSGFMHQKVILEQEIASLPVAVSISNPLAVHDAGPIAVAGIAASGTANSGNPLKGGAVYNSAAPTLTSGQVADLQANVNGALNVAIVAGGGSGGTASTFSAAFPATGTAIGATNGTNMVPLHLDGSNNLNVNVAAGGVPAGQDNTGFTSGTTQGLPVIAVYNDSVGAITSGNEGVLRCTADRKLFVAQGASVSGGWTSYTYVAAATPAAQAVKSSAGQIGWMQVTNNSASNWAYVKLFNTASGSVTLGTTSAVLNLGIPPSGGYTLQSPVAFNTAITLAVTGGIALADDTSVGSSVSVAVNLGFA